MHRQGGSRKGASRLTMRKSTPFVITSPSSLLLFCCCFLVVVSLLFHCCFIVVSLSFHCCSVVVLLLFHCCLVSSRCCFIVVLFLIVVVFIVVLFFIVVVLLSFTLEVAVLDPLQANGSLPTTASVGVVEDVSEESVDAFCGVVEAYMIVVKSSIANDALSSPITNQLHSFADEPFVAVLPVDVPLDDSSKIEGGEGAVNYAPIVAVITAEVRFEGHHPGTVNVVDVSVEKQSPVVGDGRVAPFPFEDDERIVSDTHSQTSFQIEQQERVHLEPRPYVYRACGDASRRGPICRRVVAVVVVVVVASCSVEMANTLDE